MDASKGPSGWKCACKVTHMCVAGCDGDHEGHMCVATVEPTAAPTTNPTATPTDSPTTTPTATPTATPTTAPTNTPTSAPTVHPCLCDKSQVDGCELGWYCFVRENTQQP